jgi:hypothetical protein
VLRESSAMPRQSLPPLATVLKEEPMAHKKGERLVEKIFIILPASLLHLAKPIPFVIHVQIRRKVHTAKILFVNDLLRMLRKKGLFME